MFTELHYPSYFMHIQVNVLAWEQRTLVLIMVWWSAYINNNNYDSSLFKYNFSCIELSLFLTPMRKVPLYTLMLWICFFNSNSKLYIICDVLNLISYQCNTSMIIYLPTKRRWKMILSIWEEIRMFNNKKNYYYKLLKVRHMWVVILCYESRFLKKLTFDT